MNIFIPVVGTVLSLAREKKFTLKHAGQNRTLGNNLPKEMHQEEDGTFEIKLPKGTLLTVDRLYVRKGDGAEFNSITFKFPGVAASKTPKGRFFITIDEVNNLDVEIVKPYADSVIKDIRSFINSLKLSNSKAIFSKKKLDFIRYLDKQPVLESGCFVMDTKKELEKIRSFYEGLIPTFGNEVTDSDFEKEKDVLFEDLNYSLQKITSFFEEGDDEEVYEWSLVKTSFQPLVVMKVKAFKRKYDLLRDILSTYEKILNLCGICTLWISPKTIIKSRKNDTWNNEAPFGILDIHLPSSKLPVFSESEGVVILHDAAFSNSAFTKVRNSPESENIFCFIDGRKASISDFRALIRANK